ncbi:MAG: IS200/IS605 family transposase [Candidatus Zixiibacteriota bacterium]|nr:MAG: IS200/IS605 family transposase [candidate division Zixibacteria bacterium]
MSTYTQITYHLVFATRDRKPVLSSERREDLFRYIWGITQNHHCHLYRINGVEDHIHLLTTLHPSLRLSDLVKEIKLSSGKWIKENKVFPMFDFWQDGYGAFTHGAADRPRMIEYIINQQEHHKKVSFYDELRQLLIEAGIEFDEKYLI